MPSNSGVHSRIPVSICCEYTSTGSGSLDAWHEQATARTMPAQQPDQPGTGKSGIVPRQNVDQVARAAAIAISKPPITPMAEV